MTPYGTVVSRHDVRPESCSPKTPATSRRPFDWPRAGASGFGPGERAQHLRRGATRGRAAGRRVPPCEHRHRRSGQDRGRRPRSSRSGPRRCAGSAGAVLPPRPLLGCGGLGLSSERGPGMELACIRAGCVLVRAVDVVTADGEVVRADESQNSDLYWAARGAGPGFFGIVTAFHLELQPKPAVIKATTHNYPLAARGEILSWLHGIRHEMAPIVDQALYITQHVTRSSDGPTMMLGTPGIGRSRARSPMRLPSRSRPCRRSGPSLTSLRAPLVSSRCAVRPDALLAGHQDPGGVECVLDALISRPRERPVVPPTRRSRRCTESLRRRSGGSPA
jgi:hypothetical protein